MDTPKTINLPWCRQVAKDDPDRCEKLWPAHYTVIYACPLCGWYSGHPLSYCGHCRGRLERLGILRAYFDEWKLGKMDSGM